MEQLLHYVWKHKLFPLSPLTTTWHQAVEVIDPGLHNRNAGPDFFNAKSNSTVPYGWETWRFMTRQATGMCTDMIRMNATTTLSCTFAEPSM